jgi:hypothetical protein
MQRASQRVVFGDASIFPASRHKYQSSKARYTLFKKATNTYLYAILSVLLFSNPFLIFVS